MKVIIYEFDSNSYDRDVVEKMSRKRCIEECKTSPQCVTCYDNTNLQDLLNDGSLFAADSFYRVFF